MVDGAWVRMVWHTDTFVTHQLHATRKNFGRGQKAAGRIGGSAGTSLHVSLLMRIGGNLSTGESSVRRALGRFIREQMIVGQGGAPTAKRGRTTLRRDRLGATTDDGRLYGPFSSGQRHRVERCTLAVMCAYEGARYAQTRRCIAPELVRVGVAFM